VHKEFRVGYIGSHNKRKNVGFAIKAANLIEDSNVRFEIWGSGPESIYLKQLSQNKNIVFKGFAPEELILDIYDSFDVFVFPSYYEGFGLEILKAQSRGLPVIIYKHAKIPKEVRKYCLEAESPEHMTQIIQHIKENGYNEREKKKTTEYARSFTWEKTARETLEVYNKILE
jgi:glycosyltransferase involved in cell wall biosynthesis